MTVIRESKKEHTHFPLFDVEIDILLGVKKLKEEIYENTNLNIKEEYRKLHRELAWNIPMKSCMNIGNLGVISEENFIIICQKTDHLYHVKMMK